MSFLRISILWGKVSTLVVILEKEKKANWVIFLIILWFWEDLSPLFQLKFEKLKLQWKSQDTQWSNLRLDGVQPVNQLTS